MDFNQNYDVNLNIDQVDVSQITNGIPNIADIVPKNIPINVTVTGEGEDVNVKIDTGYNETEINVDGGVVEKTIDFKTEMPPEPTPENRTKLFDRMTSRINFFFHGLWDLIRF